MKINNTKTIHDKPKFCLVYGPSGIGKTSLASQMGKKVLVLDAESGLATLQGTEIDYVSLATADDGALVPEDKRLDRLKEFMTYVQTEECRKKYDYIFIDSLTEIAQNVKKAQDKKHGATFKAWGEYADAMIEFIKFWRDQQHYTCVFIALEDYVALSDDDDAPEKYMPNIGGKKLKTFLMPQFDLVLRMIVDKEGKRKFVCKPTAKTEAKSRGGKLNEVEDANLKNVLEKMKI